MFATLIAGSLSLVGIGCLHTSWQRDRRARSNALIWSGWLMLLLSLPLWTIKWGWEFGLVYAVCAPALVAWIWIYAVRERTGFKYAQNNKVAKPLKISWPAWGYHFGLFLLVMPFLGVISTVFTLALVTLFPLDFSMQMFLALVFLPCFWGSAAAWFCSGVWLWQSALVCLLLGLISGLYLLF